MAGLDHDQGRSKFTRDAGGIEYIAGQQLKRIIEAERSAA